MACTVFRTCTLCEATCGLRFEVEGPPMASPSAAFAGNCSFHLTTGLEGGKLPRPGPRSGGAAG